MVFGNITPKTGVERIVAVIAHHPVIIHFKGIAGGFFTINQNVLTLGFYFVVLVQLDGTAVKVIVESLSGTVQPLFGKYQRAKVIQVPFKVHRYAETSGHPISRRINYRRNAFNVGIAFNLAHFYRG